jgi:hypothetical protein
VLRVAVGRGAAAWAVVTGPPVRSARANRTASARLAMVLRCTPDNAIRQWDRGRELSPMMSSYRHRMSRCAIMLVDRIRSTSAATASDAMSA